MISANPVNNLSSILVSESDAQRHVTFDDQVIDDDFVPNGVDSVEWHAMSDERRSQFMRDKRKQEAFKTELCKGFIRTGYCRYGAECRFAHFQEELRVRLVHPKYKTELCLNFSTRGECGYGSRCQFIHRSPDNNVRSHTASEANGNYNRSYTPSAYQESIQRPSSAGQTIPNRFTVSAYQPRDRHPALATDHCLNELSRLLAKSHINDRNTSQNQRFLDDSKDIIPPKWMPVPNNCCTDHGSSSNSAGSNGCGSSDYNSSSYATTSRSCSVSNCDAPNRFSSSAYQPRKRHPLFNAGGRKDINDAFHRLLNNGHSSLINDEEMNLLSCLKNNGFETNSLSGFDQWNPFTSRHLFNDFSDNTVSTPPSQLLANDDLRNGSTNMPLFSAEFPSSSSSSVLSSGIQSIRASTFLPGCAN